MMKLVSNDELYHFNPFHDKLGRFASRTGGKYVKSDGTLTPRGEKRYQKEISRNLRRSKKNKLTEESLRDTKRWEIDDAKNREEALRNLSYLNRSIQDVERRTRPSSEKMDLSNMSDSDLQRRISRELKERQYTELFGKDTQSKGRKAVRKALDVTQNTLTVAVPAATLAVLIKELKN